MHSMVTDPPAGIAFMGKDWDKDKGGRDAWVGWLSEIMREALRVLKPGGHALVWALPRTSHWTATALEDAGFEIRDVVTHLNGQGFPKGLNVSKAIDRKLGAERPVIGSDRNRGTTRLADGKVGLGDYKGTWDITTAGSPEAAQWEGWNTSLKPASEHWILCRKPIKGSVADNVLMHGTGALNVDACRVARDPGDVSGWSQSGSKASENRSMSGANYARDPKPDNPGRWPANAVISPEVATELDKQSGISGGGKARLNADTNRTAIATRAQGAREPNQTKSLCTYGDKGGASRFFYCPKPSKTERDAGVERNPHATVKSIALMRWLCRLVTPPGGIVIDPFTGSGTTGIACLHEGFHFRGCELDSEFTAIARQRLDHWAIRSTEAA